MSKQKANEISTQSESTSLEQQIREKAYQLWQEAGSPWGGEDGFWLEAERQLKEDK